jgi:hypothetical protein
MEGKAAMRQVDTPKNWLAIREGIFLKCDKCHKSQAIWILAGRHHKDLSP